MIEVSDISRRGFLRAASWSLPALGVALAAPRALADPDDQCGDRAGAVDGCVVQLPERFTSTSFSTTAVAGGTNYSILFSTTLAFGPHAPEGATGYRINSLSLTGQKRDGSPVAVRPHIGEAGPRGFGAPSASSLGFVVDVPWRAQELVRDFQYHFDLVYLAGMAEVRTCSYVTPMTLADNGMVLGGVGSVTFAPPQLESCT